MKKLLLLALLLWLAPQSFGAQGVSLTTGQYLSGTTPASGSNLATTAGGAFILRLRNIPLNPSGDKTIMELAGFMRVYVASGTQNIVLQPARAGEPTVTLNSGGRTSGFLVVGQYADVSYIPLARSVWHIYFWDDQNANKLTATQAVVDRSNYNLTSKALSVGATVSGAEKSGVFFDRVAWSKSVWIQHHEPPIVRDSTYPQDIFYSQWELEGGYAATGAGEAQFSLAGQGSPAFSTYPNAAPVADPSATVSNQGVGKVLLDGSQSYDIDNQTTLAIAPPTYSWALVSKPSGAATPTIGCATCEMTYLTGVDTTGSYTYSLTVTDDQSTSSGPVNVTVTVAAVSASISASRTSVHVGEPVVFDGRSSTGYAQGPLTGSNLEGHWGLEWDFGDNIGSYSGAKIPSPSHAYLAPGVYTVTLTARNHNNQTSTATQVVTVTPFPRSFPTTINVASGGDIQDAIDTAAAATGNVEIVLAQGGVYTLTSALVAKQKVDSGWILVRSAGTSNASWPAANVRVGSSQSSLMAKIRVTSGNHSALLTQAGVSVQHYKFWGVEFYSSQTSSGLGLVVLGDTAGDGSAAAGLYQDSESKAPRYWIFDQVYVHADPSAAKQCIRGLYLNSSEATVSNSTVDEFKSENQSQGITIVNGNGPLMVLNDYVAATGENIFTGGAMPVIAAVAPRYTVWGNHVVKYAKWDARDASYIGSSLSSTNWDVENLLEFKTAEQSIIDGNVFDRSWVQGTQPGEALNFNNIVGGGTGRKMEWLQVSNNKFLNVGQGVGTLRPRDDTPGVVGRWFLFENDLFYKVGEILDSEYRGRGSEGKGFRLLGPIGLWLNHVTMDSLSTPFEMWTMNETAGGIAKLQEVFIFNSHFRHNSYGFWGVAFGTQGFANMAGEYLMRENTVVGLDFASASASQYPSDGGTNIYSVTDANYTSQFTNYAGGDLSIVSGSPSYHAGTDGKSHGIDAAALSANTAGVSTGVWPGVGGPAPAAVRTRGKVKLRGRLKAAN
ncbi:MAG: PKD domain-containing protein [Acidobacteria bacterium]|nr:PKD domain-containing protein [Acidobacteriota bacterium]